MSVKLKVAGLLWAILIGSAGYGQDQDAIKHRLTGELSKRIDSLPPGQSAKARVVELLKYTRAYIDKNLGKEIFEANYRFDSTFNTVYWISVAGGEYTENQRTFVKSGYHDETIQDRSSDLRLIYSYNFAYRSIGPPSDGFGMYIIVAGNRSFIEIQGLVKLTPERNFTNILTEEELLRKIRKSKLKKDVRKSIIANIGKEPIGHKIDHPQGQTFGRIFYLFRVRDVENPGDYMFDPWTGELNRIAYMPKPR